MMIKKKENEERERKKNMLIGIIVFATLIIGFWCGYMLGSYQFRDEFQRGYMESCKYKIPDGCKTCTTEEAIKEFCFNARDQQSIIQCKIARQNQAKNNTIGIFIYDNYTSGVKLR